jgi:hypothetical protein
MKNLPIGIQAFDKLIEGDYIYVDKTEIIHQLVTTGATYFLSRPRRFGKSLLLPSEVFDKKSEGLYHGLIHLVFSYLGMYAQSEVHSSRGRADAVVQTTTDVFIFEFKFNKTAAEAIAQIQQKKYADKYRASNKPIIGIGVNFSTEVRGIDDWLEENL